MEKREGIIAAGNWIVDRVKKIDVWPERGMLANILEESVGTGGAPYNVLIDLAKLKAGIPLYAAGIVGNDASGKFILKDLRANRIDITAMRMTGMLPTSYTDVMTEMRSGARTFFHCRGANALLDIGHLNAIDCSARIFHLGYLLLLDRLDAPDARFGTRWGRLLAQLSKQGYKTSVDVVSEHGSRFKKVVSPVLKHVDYLILNEIEAGAVSGYRIRDARNNLNSQNLQQAAAWLLGQGVRERVVIHFPEGGYAMTHEGDAGFEPSYHLEPHDIRGTAGAGDAFCAGMLFAIHECSTLKEALRFANACAAFCLKDATCTGSAPTLSAVKKYLKCARQNKSPAGFQPI
jgi:sugar/nucleoside kinase (ribokinase family)